MTIVSKDIAHAAQLLRQGAQVAIPTETVYGLAANIYDTTAVQGIFKMKQRPLFNPLIVHTFGVEQLEQFVSYIPLKAKRLAEAFWPGSLTLVLPKKSNVPDIITAGKDTVAVRVPNHPLTLDLLRLLDFPLAAPSANPFGSISPTTAQHVKNYFDGTLKMVLDGGPCQNGIESTIVGFEGDEPVIYRLGSISVEHIEAVIGPVPVKNKKENAPQAPGMLSRHYAPDTRTFLEEDIYAFAKAYPEKSIGVISFSEVFTAPNIKAIEVLSPEANLQEAMSNLYAALHSLDAKGLDIIVAQRFPDTGLGKSMNDRLERATKGK
ncbi:threonylcarbamoyl-AMP synthase [Dokdonia sinensis]|uniref:Threonylcarbamoyl-AMP synthase n=1 Tax=Dokdonia sinensis TaxID=2479847 RepID=A0A3M0G7I6_9FLAO|nr:L-threonylcarbamoyladenylate synthase [Dokdonia sinensis]RMB60981.1 threonylcarbamoyl-AMP synthase [Dokdonia sinensis]